METQFQYVLRGASFEWFSQSDAAWDAGVQTTDLCQGDSSPLTLMKSQRISVFSFGWSRLLMLFVRFIETFSLNLQKTDSEIQLQTQNCKTSSCNWSEIYVESIWSKLMTVRSVKLEECKGQRDKNGKLVVPATTSPSHHLFFRWEQGVRCPMLRCTVHLASVHYSVFIDACFSRIRIISSWHSKSLVLRICSMLFLCGTGRSRWLSSFSLWDTHSTTYHPASSSASTWFLLLGRSFLEFLCLSCECKKYIRKFGKFPLGWWVRWIILLRLQAHGFIMMHKLHKDGWTDHRYIPLDIFTTSI